MRATLQRVHSASVSVDNKLVSKVNKGLLIFLGIREKDTQQDIKKLCDKILNLRIFKDTEGKTNLSLLDIKGDMLIISQFTLYANTKRGRRPGFDSAAKPEIALPLYESFVEEMECTELVVKTGVFGAYMNVELINDGPFTINLDTEEF